MRQIPAPPPQTFGETAQKQGHGLGRMAETGRKSNFLYLTFWEKDVF